MQLKDYYSILEIETSATYAEIKKSFRRLAQQYHPDKNNNDPYASSRFTEIKEAYEVLTNPAKKEYYLQQRWYNQSINRRKTQGIITPVAVLKQALELEKYVSTLDVYRMDKEGLKQYILALVPNSAIEQLKKFNEPETVKEIISVLLKTITALPKKSTDEIILRLKNLAESDPASFQEIEIFSARTSKKHKQEKYSLIIILTITLLLCLLIYLAGR
jgi:curved DNA-binding protein CbpA